MPLIAGFALGALLAVPAGAQQQQPPKPPPQQTSAAQKASPGKSSEITGDTARMFVLFAAQGNMAEVELATVAEQRSNDPDVKQFAEKMVHDHTSAEEKLKPIAEREQITLPAAPDAKHTALEQKLEGMQGPAFDRAYIDAMVQDHQRTVAAFREEATGGSNPSLTEYAEKAIPTLQEHLQMARKIDARLNKQKK